MLDSEIGEFRRFLTDVLSFWRQDVSEFALSVWWQAMRPYDMAAVRQAFSRHAMNPDGGQFAPKPADVVKMLSGRTADQALQAWALVDKAVRQVGTYQTVVFDDPLTHRVITDMGGWCSLGTKSEDEWPFVAKEFENRYRGFRMRSETPEYPAKLIGKAEAHNASKGHDIAPPILVGDQAKARAVLQGGSMLPALRAEPLKSLDLSGAVKQIAEHIGEAA